MIRLLVFVLIILGLAAGFAWLADRPGELSILWEGQLIEMSLTAAVTLIVAIVVSVMIVWWLLRSIWNSPHSVRRYFRARTRDRGYQSLSTGLIAAGAGNAALAHKMSSRARGLLRADQEPLILVLEAQTALIEGRQDDARRMFQQMADDPETRELGLRGLYLEATRLGAHEAARQYAETAAENAPYLPWAAKATLEYRSQSGRWDDAIRLLEQQKVANVLKKSEAERLKAVLLTAKAEEQLEGDPIAARDNAVRALKHAKDLVPAALVAAKAYMREDNLRKASSVLEQVWKLSPHPDVAKAYVRLRSGDSAADRLKRAEKLQGYKPNNPESLMIVAEAALDTTDFTKAREKAEAVARMEPSERVFLLLADIEEAETGDQGRVRHWMANALRAPRDATWVADGYVSDKWLPLSPVNGRLDAFEWKVPFGQLAGPLEEGAASHGEQALQSLPPVLKDQPAEETKAETFADQVPMPGPAPTEKAEIATNEASSPPPVEAKVSADAADGATEEKAAPEPFFGRPPDDPGVRDPNRKHEDNKTRLGLF